MINKTLIETRKARNFTQKQMAAKIAMDQTTYSKKELGKTPIREDEWQRIANILEVPVEEIKQKENPNAAKYDNCTFNETAIGIQYVNIPQNVFDIIIKYNDKLERDNAKLDENDIANKQIIADKDKTIKELEEQIKKFSN